MGNKFIFISALFLFLIPFAYAAVTLDTTVFSGQEMTITITPSADGVMPTTYIEKNGVNVLQLDALCSESKCLSRKTITFNVPSAYDGRYNFTYTDVSLGKQTKEFNVVNLNAGEITPGVTEIVEEMNETETTCTDSDGGKDYYVKGNATGATSTGGINTINDGCVVGGSYDGWLREAVCEDNIVNWFDYECPNGCENGACLPETNAQPAKYNCAFAAGYDCKHTEGFGEWKNKDDVKGATCGGECPTGYTFERCTKRIKLFGVFSIIGEFASSQNKILTMGWFGDLWKAVVRVIMPTEVRPLCSMNYSTDYGQTCNKSDEILKTSYWDSVNNKETTNKSGWTACSYYPGCGKGKKIAEEVCTSEDRADLIVEDVTITPGSVMGIPALKLQGYVRNIGNAPAPKSRVEVLVTPPQPEMVDQNSVNCYRLGIGDLNAPNRFTSNPIPANDLIPGDVLEPGQRERFYEYFHPFESGTINVTIIVDNGSAVAESNETNNIYSKSVDIVKTIEKGSYPNCNNITASTPKNSCMGSSILNQVYGVYQNGTKFNYTDICVNASALKDYFCAGDNVLTNVMFCQYGCSNGACLPATPLIELRIKAGEAQMLVVNGTEHEINLTRVISNNNASIMVNQTLIEINSSNFVYYADNLKINVSKISYNSTDSAKSYADLLVTGYP